MIRKPQFVSERITCQTDAFDVSMLSRGEPSPPAGFTWRGQGYVVARTLATRRQLGDDRGDHYVRRHYYDIETSDALRMTLYFERNPSDHSKSKAWWLYTVTMPDAVIETERLLLRRWTLLDRDAFRLMVADPDVMRHLHALAPMSPAEADDALAATIERYSLGYGDWAIEDRVSGDIMGESGLTSVDPAGDEWIAGRGVPETAGEVEIGWMLRLPYWGQGYALEAASAVKRFAFESLALPRVVAFVRPGNQRSSQLAVKLGMQAAGRVKNKRGHELLKYVLTSS